MNSGWKPTIELQTSGYSTLTTQAPNYTTYKLVREWALLKRKLLLPPGRQFANLDLSLPGFGQGCRDHFQGMLDMIGGWLLLLAAMPWCSGGGLPGPPDDSLNVPLEGGLLGRIEVVGATFSGADAGSEGACCFGAFLPSELKLPNTICR